MRPRRFADSPKSYAIHRMGVAVDRMLTCYTPEGKRQAARWAIAWCVASGGNIPSGMKLRQRPRPAPSPV